MPTPDFVLALRRKIGHDLLWLPAVTAVVLREDGRVLLARRSDNGNWGLVSGIVEPGEEPAVTAVRECLEETGVVVAVEELVAVTAGDPVQYPNGDRCQFLDHTLRCRYVSGEARVNDDESLEVGWYSPDALPPMPAHQLARLRRAWDRARPPATEEDRVTEQAAGGRIQPLERRERSHPHGKV